MSTPLRGTCHCGAPVVEYPEGEDEHEDGRTKNTGWVYSDGSAVCWGCDAEAEARALSDAESGAGMERIRDWEYSMRYDD